MIRRHGAAVLSHLAALLPGSVPEIVDGVLVDHWCSAFEHLDLMCDGDLDDLTTAIEQLAATWDSATPPRPAHVSALLKQLRSTRTRVSALSAARAAIANSTVPSLKPTRPTFPRRTA